MDTLPPEADQLSIGAAARPIPEIPGFEVHRVIGEGSCGVLWHATQEGTLREVALKVLAPWKGYGAARLRFDREAEIAASLEHQNVCKVFECGDCAAGPWLAMEFVDGLPANQWSALHAPSLRETVAVFCGICAGVGHAHQRGVLHRDLKPANVLVTRDGVPKVVDFGLAGRTDGSSLEASLTRHGDVLGTIAWMSPEQAGGRWEEVDALSDIHSLGGILFTMVTGRPPIDTSLPPAAQLLAAQSPDRPRLSEHSRTKIPRDLDAVCAKCLDGARSRRYRSVAELEADLERWLAGAPVRIAVGAPFYAARKQIRRHWIAAVAVFTAVCGISGAGIGYYQGVRNLERQEKSALERTAIQNARSLQEAQSFVAELLVEVRSKFDDAGHPEWIGELERKLAEFSWDTGDQVLKPFDERKFRSKASLAQGDLFAEKGRWGGALFAYQEAVKTLGELGSNSPRAAYGGDLVRARLGEMRALAKLGHHKEALKAGEKAISLVQAIDEPLVREGVVSALATGFGTLAQSFRTKPEYAAPLCDLINNGVAVLSADGQQPREAEALAKSQLLACLADVLWRSGDLPGAAAAAESATGIARKAASGDGTALMVRRTLATALVAQANVATARGSAGDSCELLTEATSLLAADRPRLTLSNAVHVALAEAWERVGGRLAANGQSVAAMKANQQAIDLWEAQRQRGLEKPAYMALSRLSLRNAVLGAADKDATAVKIHATSAMTRFLTSRRDGMLSAATALNALEAFCLLSEFRIPDRAEQATPSLDVAKAAVSWLQSTDAKPTKEERERLKSLGDRLAASGVTTADKR